MNDIRDAIANFDPSQLPPAEPIDHDAFRGVSWSAGGVLPGGRCHHSPDGVIQWAVYWDARGRRCQRVITVDGESVS